jgi:hypothetical protein
MNSDKARAMIDFSFFIEMPFCRIRRRRHAFNCL